jgi:hypothetical protein
MKVIRLAAAIIALLGMPACVPLASLNPLWDEGHVVSEPALTGSWVSHNGDAILTVAGLSGGRYRLTYVADDSASQYEVHAVRLESRLFLDVYPDSDWIEKRLDGEAYQSLVRTHFFLRAVLEENRLELAIMDDEALEKKLEQEGLAVSLVSWKDGLLLTAPTDQVQKLVTHFADDPGVWGEPEIFHLCRARQEEDSPNLSSGSGR